MVAKFKLILMLFSLIFTSSCGDFKAWIAKEFKQGQVAEGTARLSAQYASIILSQVNEKFKDPSAEVQIIEASEGADNGQKRGQVIWSLKDTVIDYPKETEVYEDCFGSKATWQGKARIISATKRMTGILTNNPQKPVIPDANSVEVEVLAELDGLTIKFIDKSEYLTMNKGLVAYKAFPRLAQIQDSELKGMLLAPTSNTTYKNVKFSNVEGELHTKDVDMAVTIENSDLHMQIGQGEDGQENLLLGKISLFNNVRDVPLDGHALDPNYDRHRFIQTYSCKEGLNGKVSYDHLTFEEKFAAPIAGLSTQLMSAILSAVVDDTVCGLSSPRVLRRTHFSADNQKMGIMTNEFDDECEIELKNFKTSPNCFGVAHVINGAVTIKRARKELSGKRLLSDKGWQNYVDGHERLLDPDGSKRFVGFAIPFFPNKVQPLDIGFSAVFKDVSMREFCSKSGSINHPDHCRSNEAKERMTFRISSGEASANFKPMLAIQKDSSVLGYNKCSALVPNAKGSFSLKNIKAAIEKGGGTLQTGASGSFEIVSGRIGDEENQLVGELVVGDKKVRFNDENKPYSMLNPHYDRERHINSYMSCQKLKVPASDDDCAPKLP